MRKFDRGWRLLDMRSEWTTDYFDKKIEILGGGTPKTTIPEYWNGPIPWLSVKDFNNDIRYVYETEKSITKEGLKNSSTQLLDYNNIIISARGTVGELAMIPFPMAFNQSCYGIKPVNNEVNSVFLYYLLKTKISELKQKTHGSVFNTITRQTFSNILVNWPSLPEQKHIAATLSCLDDKIELNNKINANLEAQAQAIFKNWFVDFVPFKDSEFVNSELGKIPKGWQINCLGNLVNTIDNRGKTPPLSSVKTDFPIIDVRALSGDGRIIDYSNCTKYVDEITYNTWFRSGHPLPYDILISTVGSLAELKLYLGNIGCIAQNVVALRSDKNISFYLYSFLKYIKKDLISYNIGSVQPSIKVTHIMKHPILIPPKEIIDKYAFIVNSITKKLFHNHCQYSNLVALRDTLLPKLMSGEIEVPVAEAIISERS